LPARPASRWLQSTAAPFGDARTNRRCLHCAPPDFLLGLVALANFHAAFVTESRTRGPVYGSAAGNPGTLGMTKVSSVTDLWLVMPRVHPCVFTFVANLCHPDQQPLSMEASPSPLSSRPATALYGSVALPFVIPTSNRSLWKRRPPLCHPDQQPLSMEASPSPLSSRPATALYRSVALPFVIPTSNRSPWKRRPPLCHPERSRGICSSADHDRVCGFP
jgi:hypothetical protein